MNRIKQEKIKTLQNIFKAKNPVYYVGPIHLGNYGHIDERMSYKETKSLYGNTAHVIQTDEVCIIMDRRSRIIVDNLYENGKGNLFFINIGDKST